MESKDLRIVFMGTPEFAVAALDILVQNNYNIIGVITAPDKPAGRGQQIQQSAVKDYALQKGLNILQPVNLKDENFLEELKNLKADLQIVVAFRMLPEVVWNMPRLGTFNLHGSLLPQYRGAAPINWAIINGEKETGVTTFFLQHEIDTGRVLFREKLPIGENDTASEVHDNLMELGAQLVLKTVKAIEARNYNETDQENLIDGELKHAPKIFKENCEINWQQPANKIHDLIRGLSSYPAAWTNLSSTESKIYSLKIFKTTIESTPSTAKPGSVETDGKTYIKVNTQDKQLRIIELQAAGKKKMRTEELLRGFSINENWYFKHS